jgi:hypothetical protein
MVVGRWMDENLSTQGYRLSGNERKGDTREAITA